MLKGSLYRKQDYEGVSGAPARTFGKLMWQCWHSGDCTSSLRGISKCQQLWLSVVRSSALASHSWCLSSQWKPNVYLSICETSLRVPRKTGRAPEAGRLTTEGDRDKEGKLCFYIIRGSYFYTSGQVAYGNTDSKIFTE